MCTQINAFVILLRQTQTPTVFAAPQLLTSPQSQIKELVPPWLLSARQTPSFLFRRHTQRNRSTRSKATTRPQTTRGSNRKSSRCGYCFQCPRWHCSSVRFGTIDTTPLSRCLNWKTRFQASNTQPSHKGCWNNSELLWYTNHLVTKRQKHLQKFSSQAGPRPNASNQLAGVTSLYQTSRLVTRLVKNEMFHSNSYTKSSCNTEQHGNLMFHLQNSSSHRYVLP